MDQDVTWYEVGLGPDNIVLDGDPASPKKGHSHHFSALVYCGQTDRLMKMPLGRKVGLGLSLGHIVLDWDPWGPMGTQLPIKGHRPLLIFGPCLLWPNGPPSQLLLSTCLHVLWCTLLCSPCVYKICIIITAAGGLNLFLDFACNKTI